MHYNKIGKIEAAKATGFVGGVHSFNSLMIH